jgi:proteasome lid subunit RPN8/RPN11
VDVLLTDDELAQINQHAEADYPAECCGVVLVHEGADADRIVVPCRNIQDDIHAKDPVRFPRDARTAYYIAHENLLEIGRRESQGHCVHVIYHSHVDVGAYFSETDRQNALVDGEPAYPRATYVVVGVRDGRAGEARAFRWEATRRDFAEVPLTGP